MTFGFGVGDFITVGGLCWKVYKKCKDSPGNYAQLFSEVGSLHNVIMETEEMLSQQDLTSEQKAKLAQCRQGCEEVLKDLEGLLNRYESMGTNARRTFDRMGFGMEDMTGIRLRLISNVTMLDAFNTTFSHAKLENKLNLLIAEVRSGRREVSLISNQTFDTAARNKKEAWEELRKELEDIGISPSVITEKRQFIIEWFQEAIAAGRLDEDAPSDHEDYAISSYALDDPVPWPLTLQGLEHENENDTAPSMEMSSSMIGPPTTEQGVAVESISSRKHHSEQSAGVSHARSSRDNKNPRLRVSYLTYILRGKHRQFLEAASSGDVPRMEYLLYKGAEIDTTSKSEGGRSALLLAAENGREEAVKVLLEKGANVNAKGSERNTGLHLAAKSGHWSTVQVLLKKGANSKAKNSEGDTALHLAAQFRHESVVHVLLNKRANLDAKDGSKKTALHRAAMCGHEFIVRVLLDKGANLDARDSKFYTALHLAAKSGHWSTVQALLDKGADLEAKISGITTATTALHCAAESGHESVVRVLLKKGADHEVRNSYNATALHLAARFGHELIVQVLLEKGADLEARTLSDETALHLAARSGHWSIVQALLDKGANLEAQTSVFRTALHCAAESGYESVVRVLLKKGADLGAKTSSGKTALHLVAHFGHELIVQVLLKKGADLEAKTLSGETALHLAAYFGHESIVQILLEEGADLDVKNNYNETVLHCAAESGHESVVRVLLKNGADFEAQTSRGGNSVGVGGKSGQMENYTATAKGVTSANF